MTNLEYKEVFVPGGFPRHTYNPRLTLELETGLLRLNRTYAS